MGKVHGSLARAGKVRGQTPKVAKQDKKKKPRGRAHKRMQYNRRFVTAECNRLSTLVDLEENWRNSEKILNEGSLLCRGSSFLLYWVMCLIGAAMGPVFGASQICSEKSMLFSMVLCTESTVSAEAFDYRAYAITFPAKGTPEKASGLQISPTKMQNCKWLIYRIGRGRYECLCVALAHVL
ncbi:hypothetical protein POTOM_050590 [Populus tomentosa]|uniref:40S ribosomal protein S30 n=1 Tax=Populus tomentosa TaxID=118781 RepID=A0A8X8C9K6_POPTO|nr:hypothetical protein POTOM_050590 [Populus tomentosa]